MKTGVVLLSAVLSLTLGARAAVIIDGADGSDGPLNVLATDPNGIKLSGLLDKLAWPVSMGWDMHLRSWLC